MGKGAYVDRADAPEGAMSGRVIAVAPSHGRYYEEKLDRWEWQRARLHTTVEDLFSASFVLPFLTPMLENAGAYVVMPRERDTSVRELIIDPDGEFAIDGYSEIHAHKRDKKLAWTDSPRPGFGLTVAELTDGQNPFAMGKARQTHSTAEPDKAVRAQWRAEIPATGDYAVYVSYQSSPKSCPRVTYTVNAASGPATVTIDQRIGGGTWTYVGTFRFMAGEGDEPLVELTSLSDSPGTICADAIKIGGGMGNVARGRSPHTSGMPRYAEGARYWLQWAGMPDSVYAGAEGEITGDYRDDMFARPKWVNYLKNELGVPVDLFLSFHTDAGVKDDPAETVGTMGIFYTNRGRTFPDGRSRRLNRELADSVVSSVTRDIRAKHDPEWTRRKMRDKSYVEIRIPEVPSMLIELLSHQNYADMALGLDPQFRFDVSRAVYKGLLHYLAARKLARYVVQPLPVTGFAITRRERASSPAELTLSWLPADDPLEPTARPARYRVEERTGDPDNPFRHLAETVEPRLNVEIAPGQIHSYRVIAINDGGESFPSEVLSAGYSVRSASEWITVVNAFTRVSAPDSFWAGDFAGFGMRDAGVPWGNDAFRTGRVHEFSRKAEWADDDDPGFGASGWELEGKTVTGNTFDFTATHGEAILECGRSFVSCSAAAFCADTLSTPPVVDLMLGLQTDISADLQRRLQSAAAQGAGLIVSGAFVGTATPAAMAATLGITGRGSIGAAPTGVSVVTSAFFTTFSGKHYSFATDIPYQVSSCSGVDAGTGAAAVVMRYDGSLIPAAVAHKGQGYNSLTLGFPFEIIARDDSRKNLMKQTLKFLNEK